MHQNSPFRAQKAPRTLPPSAPSAPRSSRLRRSTLAPSALVPPNLQHKSPPLTTATTTTDGDGAAETGDVLRRHPGFTVDSIGYNAETGQWVHLTVARTIQLIIVTLSVIGVIVTVRVVVGCLCHLRQVYCVFVSHSFLSSWLSRVSSFDWFT